MTVYEVRNVVSSRVLGHTREEPESSVLQTERKGQRMVRR